MSAIPAQRLSYDLDEGMLKAIGEEFSPEKITSRFAEILAQGEGDIEKAGREVFSNYGKSWMERSLELGEKYTDATYEIMKKAIAVTGAMYFPMKPQRFIEIAYLGVMSFLSLRVVQNNGQKLVFRLPQCDIYSCLREKTGPVVADLLPCRHGCLTALETLFDKLDIAVNIQMEAAMPRDGYCQFAASRVER